MKLILWKVLTRLILRLGKMRARLYSCWLERDEKFDGVEVVADSEVDVMVESGRFVECPCCLLLFAPSKFKQGGEEVDA